MKQHLLSLPHSQVEHTRERSLHEVSEQKLLSCYVFRGVVNDSLLFCSLIPNF